MNLSFLKNKNTIAGSFYLIGNLFNKAIVFLTIPVFTRLLTTSEYGMVSTYISWVTIVGTFIGLSLGSSIRTAFVDFKQNINAYISSIMFLSTLNFIVTSFLIIVITYLFAPQIDRILVMFCLIQAFMTCVINTISIKYMMELQYIKRTILLALPNVLVVILSIIFILLIDKDKYMGRIFAYVLVYLFIGLGYLVKALIEGNKLICLRYWKYALKFSLPLIFHGMSVVLLSQVDRTMITTIRNASETGIYSLVYSFSMIALVVTSSMESVWIPWFTNKMQINDKESINNNVVLYIEIVMVTVIGIMFVAPEVLKFMTPEEYWNGKILLPPIILASFFMFLYSISVDLEYYCKSTKIIATNTIIAAIINIVLNLIFIPYYGALAAAFTTVFSYMVSFGIHYKAARKLDNKLFPFKLYIKPILIMGSAVISSYIMMNYGVVRWGLAIFGFCLYVFISYKKDRFIYLLK